MTKISFDKRLLCDLSFYKDILSKDFMRMRQLMYININSKDHPRNHNVISEKDFKKILEENPRIKKYPDIIKASLKPINEPEVIEIIKDEISRNLLHAIHLSTFPPYNAVILTTSGKLKAYEKHPFYKTMGVVAKAEKEALYLINEYFQMCMDKEKY